MTDHVWLDSLNNDGRVLLSSSNSTLPGRSHAGLPALQGAMMALFAEWQEVRSSERRRAEELVEAMGMTRHVILSLAR